MARVTGAGGTVASYTWDLVGGRGPTEAIDAELRNMGVPTARLPNFDASAIDAMRDLWTEAGLVAVETREITVRRTFADFADYWAANLLNPRFGPAIAAMTSSNAERLKARVQVRLPPDAAGHITDAATANAIKACVPS